MSTGPPGGARVLHELGLPECHRLLGQEQCGHLAYTETALPAVAPVRCAVVGGEVLVAVPGDRVLAAARGTVVALQVGRFDPSTLTGWSVTAVGRARAVRDEQPAPRLSSRDLALWSPSSPPLPAAALLLVESALVSGWTTRCGAAAPLLDGGP